MLTLAATNMTYEWKYDDIFESDCFEINGIREGDYYIFDIIFLGKLFEGKKTGVLKLCYSDILGNDYEQRVIIKFDLEKDCVEEISTDYPKFTGTQTYV